MPLPGEVSIAAGRYNGEAVHILTALKGRLKECRLKAHPEKTKIVYCKKDGRNGYFGSDCATDFGGFVPGISVRTVPMITVRSVPVDFG